ncbi:MAG: CD225/dispanin family protein [Verrucomicrobiota bacterium]
MTNDYEDQGRRVEIPNYLWQSIVLTILCCWPLGIPAIYHANQVNARLIQGDRESALEASNKARELCWIAFGLGLGWHLIINLAWIGFFVAGLALEM